MLANGSELLTESFLETSKNEQLTGGGNIFFGCKLFVW